MLTILVVAATIIFTFYFSTLFGWAVHKLLHQSIMGPLNKAHLSHHDIQYPPGSFFSEDSYIGAGKSNSIFLFAPFAIVTVALVVGIMLWFGAPLWLPILFVLETTIISFLHDYLHAAFHVKNHWVRNFSWYKHLCSLNIQHHHFQDKNFGIFHFMWDRLFSTYKDDVDIKNP